MVHIEIGQRAENENGNDRRNTVAFENGLHCVSGGAVGIFYRISADNGAKHPNAAHQKRIDNPFVMSSNAPERNAQNQTRHNGYFIGFKDIGRHTGAVAHVVAHQVRHYGGVARVIFGNAGFHFAHQVGAYVSGFGVNAAAYAHKQGQQRTAKAKPQQSVRRGNAENDKDERAAQKAQAVGQHTGYGAGAVRNFQRVAKAAFRSRRHAYVGVHRDAHTQLAY